MSTQDSLAINQNEFSASIQKIRDNAIAMDIIVGLGGALLIGILSRISIPPLVYRCPIYRTNPRCCWLCHSNETLSSNTIDGFLYPSIYGRRATTRIRSNGMGRNFLVD